MSPSCPINPRHLNKQGGDFVEAFSVRLTETSSVWKYSQHPASLSRRPRPTGALGGLQSTLLCRLAESGGSYAVLCLPVLTSCGGGGPSLPALQVTSLADDGGNGELRAEIIAAAASPGSGITFQNGLSGVITLSANLPAITTGTTIQGPGASLLAINGANQYRPFTVNAANNLVTISGLAMRRGSGQPDSSGNFGGGGAIP